MLKNYKLLPYQMIKELIDDGLIKNTNYTHLQPASLDVLCNNNHKIIIRKNTTEIIPLVEDFTLVNKNKPNIFVAYSARSTTARNGIYTKYIMSANALSIRPLAYDIILPPRARLGQVYFFDKNHKVDALESTKFKIDHKNILKYNETYSNFYSSHTSEIYPNNFYLINSDKTVKIKSNNVGFLVETLPNYGIYTTHLNAGFFDPGFNGSIVCETYTAIPTNIRDKVFGKMLFLLLIEPTTMLYSEKGNYHLQTHGNTILPKIDYSLEGSLC